MSNFNCFFLPSKNLYCDKKKNLNNFYSLTILIVRHQYESQAVLNLCSEVTPFDEFGNWQINCGSILNNFDRIFIAILKYSISIEEYLVNN